VTARRKARKRALDVLYEAELRGEAVDTVITRRAEADPDPAVPMLAEWSITVARGVEANRGTIDTILASHTQGWPLERMPSVDRNLSRIGAWELLYVPEVPTAVAISEAVALAGELSTEESPSYVNGLLSAVARAHPRPSAGLEGAAGLGGHDAPLDELLGEGARAGVVDDGKGA
jgi:N utilization substance protein B